MPDVVLDWLLPIGGTLLASFLVGLLKQALDKVTGSITGLHDQVKLNAVDNEALRELTECIDSKLDGAVADNQKTHREVAKELKAIHKEMTKANGRTSKLEGSIEAILHYEANDQKGGTS